MHKKVLILYAPVIHAGYLDFFAKHKDQIESTYLIPDALVEKLSRTKPDIATVPTDKMRDLLNSLGYKQVSVFSEDKAKELSQKSLLLINDHISRELQKTYFPGSNVEWDSVFLRWDIDSIHTEDTSLLPESQDSFDQELISKAYTEAKKSSDWWRQVGAVLLKEGTVIGCAHNEGMPSDHTPYQRGAVRDFLQPGEQPELVDTIHAEQKLIAQAARDGVPLKGTSLYVTHFPCPVCAKLIINAGISKCFFAEGWSTLASAPLFKNAQAELIKVILKH